MNPFNKVAVVETADGMPAISFIAENSQLITLVCEDKESAKILASHISAMVRYATINDNTYKLI